MTQSGQVPDTHAEAWALLPFIANGRISAEEREWVESHVQSCAACREELMLQRSLAQQLRDTQTPFASGEQRAFNKLWTRIEASESALPSQPEAARSAGAGPRRTVRWLAAAVVVQAIGLALLGITALRTTESAPGEFRTVTNAETRTIGPAIRLVFSADASIADVSDMLLRHGLELVGGPQGGGIFTAGLKDTSAERSAESVAAHLRADERVQFAEPIVP